MQLTFLGSSAASKDYWVPQLPKQILFLSKFSSGTSSKKIFRFANAGVS